MNYIPKWLAILAATLLCVFLVTLSLNQISILNSRMKPGADKRTLTISATGKVTAVPDLATIYGSVIVEGQSAQEVKDKAAKKVNDVLDAIKAFGVEKKDLQTSGYYVSPKYNYRTGTQEIIGYSASETLTIKVRNQQKVGNVIDIMTENGINQVSQVQYSFVDPDEFRQQAREKAVTSARIKAEKLASVAGVRLGRVVSFEEHNAAYPTYPYPVTDSKAILPSPAELGVVPQFEPGTNEITATVSVVYELK